VEVDCDFLPNKLVGRDAEQLNLDFKAGQVILHRNLDNSIALDLTGCAGSLLTYECHDELLNSITGLCLNTNWNGVRKGIVHVISRSKDVSSVFLTIPDNWV